MTELLDAYNTCVADITRADRISPTSVERIDVMTSLPVEKEFYWIHVPSQSAELSMDIRRHDPTIPPEYNNVAIRYANGKAWNIRFHKYQQFDT